MRDDMLENNQNRKAYLVGGGIGSLAAAAFVIRDAGMQGKNITIYEAKPLLGGSLDAAPIAEGGYSLRGGRMLTTDNYECMWDLYKTIPSLNDTDMSVYDEVVAFNKRVKAHSQARLIDRNRSIVDVSTMGFTMRDRAELLILSEASEEKLGTSIITDWLSPGFFTNNFFKLLRCIFPRQRPKPGSYASCKNNYLHILFLFIISIRDFLKFSKENLKEFSIHRLLL